MPTGGNIVFKLGSIDLSNFVRVNPGQGFDPASAEMLEPAFSDSPLYEGQVLTSLHAKNKQMKIPLYLHPSSAPYLADALNQVVQQVNQALRPCVDLGQSVQVQWNNAQATNPTYFTVQFGRFDPAFNFRETEHGYLAGVLNLWVLPYAHTGTERLIGTFSVSQQSGLRISPSQMLATTAGGTVVGDVSPQFEIRMWTGSYTNIGGDGRIGIISALPFVNYTPVYDATNLSNSAANTGLFKVASGGWLNEAVYMNMNFGASVNSPAPSPPFGFGAVSVHLTPGSAYSSGDNRVFGLVRARYGPFGMRAFDPSGNPLGPTVIASAMDGFQLVDFGTVRVSPWQSSVDVLIRAYDHIPPSASGMYAPRRAWLNWSQEISAAFVLPTDTTILDLDFNSPILAMDGFDGALGANPLSQPDVLGNTWSGASAYNVTASQAYHDGKSNLRVQSPSGNVLAMFSGGSAIDLSFGGMVLEAIVSWDNAITSGLVSFGAGRPDAGAVFSFLNQVHIPSGGAGTAFFVGPQGGGATIVFTAIPSQYYEFRTHNFAANGTATGWISMTGPSGAFPVAPSAMAASAAWSFSNNPSSVFPYLEVDGQLGNVFISAFRARAVATTWYPADIIHLYQNLGFNTRAPYASPGVAPVDTFDLQARQRGPLSAISLLPPSMGGGLFAAAIPFDQGAVNDNCAVDIRVRERFTYAR